MTSIAQFIQKSGFKVLAMARLSQCEYSVILYLMNCAASGLDQIITTEAELSSLIGYEEEQVTLALESLAQRYLIKAHYSDAGHMATAHPSIRVGFQLDMDRWLLDYEKDATSHDAVVYPFLRQQGTLLELIPGQRGNRRHGGETHTEERHQHTETWARVLDSFMQGRSLDDDEIEENQLSAQILVDTHPVDQVLLLLRHFQLRIPNLSLLASNWDHYQELYEHETQKVDFIDARKKHQELDDALRKNTKQWLNQAQEYKLSPSEINILKLLIRHRHPRRQLFWAFQARSRYTNLERFFEENTSLMLAVTTTGTIVKKPHTTTTLLPSPGDGDQNN